MTANELCLLWNEPEIILNKLDKAYHEFNHRAIRDILLTAPTGLHQQMVFVI